MRVFLKSELYIFLTISTLNKIKNKIYSSKKWSERAEVMYQYICQLLPSTDFNKANQ